MRCWGNLEIMIGCIEDAKRNKKHTISREKIEIKDKKNILFLWRGCPLRSRYSLLYTIGLTSQGSCKRCRFRIRPHWHSSLVRYHWAKTPQKGYKKYTISQRTQTKDSIKTSPSLFFAETRAWLRAPMSKIDMKQKSGAVARIWKLGTRGRVLHNTQDMGEKLSTFIKRIQYLHICNVS